ncbi:MAG: hypothetical protein ACTHMG_04535 [Sphingomonas sp.]
MWLVAGAAMRLVWLSSARGLGTFTNAGEATNVAWSLARQGTFADAFFTGQGATAHLLPTAPLISAALIRLAGGDPGGASMILTLWCLVQTTTVVGLAALLFRRLGTRLTIIEAIVGSAALMPVFVPEEMIDFRYWENGLAAALALANLLLMLRLSRCDDWRRSDKAAIALLSAACFFVSPPAGLAIDGCWAFHILRRRRLGEAAGLAFACALALAALIAPWALRNRAALGEAVLLRSDFGLELALGTDPGQAIAVDPAARFRHRLEALHPYWQPADTNAVVSGGGELAYSRQLQRSTWQWIKHHPVPFGRIIARHYRQFFVPAPWQLAFSEWPMATRSRAALTGAINLLGLIALVMGCLERRRFYPTLLAYVLLAGIPYSLVQPIPRYAYLVYPLLLFAGGELVVRIAAAITRRAQDARGRRGGGLRGGREPPCRG